MVSAGRLLGFILALGAVYFCWGMVFSRDGTGSNVVLGLLLALAALYFLTQHLGTFFDDLFAGKAGRETRQLMRFAKAAAQEANTLLEREKSPGKARLSPELRAKLKVQQEQLSQAVAAMEAGVGDEAERLQMLKDALDQMEALLQGAAESSPGLFGQMRSLVLAFSVALALRAFVVEPFQIPSSSMIPTLLIGDHLFVARFIYGLQSPFGDKPSYLVRWAQPEPGDVVVFVAPPYVGSNAGEDWIKRVIAGPGQRVRMENSVLYVDDTPYAHIGEPVAETYRDYEEYSKRWNTDEANLVIERVGDEDHTIYLSAATMRTWPGIARQLDGLDCSSRECRVKEGHVFVMGDNRDRSSDGRRWGAVPVDNIKGKALFIWMSVDGSERSVDIGNFTLPAFRWERLFEGIR